jgi:CrcB protein
MPSLLSVFYAALGGAFGSVSRYLLGTWVQSVSRNIDFPYGTLTVNLIGCFVIGFLSQLAETHGVFSPQTRAFLFIGILGGFTTFSSLANETYNLFSAGETLNALANIGANVILGLLLVWLGRALAFWTWN